MHPTRRRKRTQPTRVAAPDMHPIGHPTTVNWRLRLILYAHEYEATISSIETVIALGPAGY